MSFNPETDEYSPEFLKSQQERLEQDLQGLLQQNKRNLHEMMDQERVRGDSLDESTQEQGAATELRLRDREKNLLHDIEAAIGRIHEGSYGECDKCGDLIPPKRLMVYPTAKLCVSCKEEEERYAKHVRNRPGMFDELPSSD